MAQGQECRTRAVSSEELDAVVAIRDDHETPGGREPCHNDLVKTGAGAT
jgi:hypothetical protein